MESGRTAPFEILLVEDDPISRQLTSAFLARAEVPTHLSVVNDGVQALEFLHRQGPYGDERRPDLILLDMNLPAKSGLEVLAEIKADENLRPIPVCMLTSSDTEQDVLRAYGSGANCFICKPPTPDLLNEVVKGIESFWLKLARLPSPPVPTRIRAAA